MISSAKSLSKFLVVAFLVSSAGCAAAPEQDDERDLVAEAQSALLGKKDIEIFHPLEVRATFDPQLGRTMVDLTSNAFPQQPGDPDPHDGDDFLAVLVYVDRSNGVRDLLTVLTRQDYYGRNQIGPGGGCIHFSVPAAVGDRLAIGAVVKLEGENRARIAAAPATTVEQGAWGVANIYGPAHQHHQH
jgi:hypothetical protein